MSDEAARMIERLRDYTPCLQPDVCIADRGAVDAAADLIASQQAEIEQLQAKLAAALKLLNWWRSGDDRAKSPDPVIDV